MIPVKINMEWIEGHRAKVNAANLSAKPEAVQSAAKDILASLKSIERNLYWALDNDEDDVNWCLETLLERAHYLVDLANDYRALLRKVKP
jgi:hypothetical protein